MKRIKIILLINIMVIVGILSLSDSWAVDKPTTTFTGSSATVIKKNIISDQLNDEQSATYQTVLHNFDVANNYKTNSNILMYSLMKNLEFASSSEQFEITADNPKAINDPGIFYILANGYNTVNTKNSFFKNTSLDDSTKQYITQVVLWQYINKHQDKFSNICIPTIKSGINACDFYDSNLNTKISNSVLESTFASFSSNQTAQLITSFLDAAENYTEETSSIEIGNITSYNYNNKTVSTVIDIKPKTDKSNYLYYSISIEDPNNYGAYILNDSGQHVTSLNDVDKNLRVFVPLKDDLTQMDLTTVKVRISATFMKNEMFRYSVTNSTNPLLANGDDNNKHPVYSDILLAYIGKKQVNSEVPLKNFVKVSKVDIANMQELPGATLVISDLSGTKIDTWQSTEEPHYVVLSAGNYKLCETIPPTNYQLNTECVNFEVKNNQITSVIMRNTRTPDIPDTAAFKNTLGYVIGIGLFAFGVGAITITLRKKKNQPVQ